MAQENQEVIGLMMRGEDKEVLEDINITPQGIPLGENMVSQFHPLLGSIRGGLRRMSYKEK
jgi:hypothetical protein